MLTLFFLRGLPGSGKSALAELMGVPFYEADQFQVGKFDPSKLTQAHDWCYDRTLDSLLHGLSCTVSNTSTAEWEVERYAKLAERMNARFVSLVVENRHEGVSIHDVPEDTMKNMEERFSLKLR